MPSNATISAAPSEGSITLTGTAADDYLEITSGAVREVHVYFDNATAGTFGYTTSGAQALSARDYQLVWKRPTAQAPAASAAKVYFGGATVDVKWIAF